MKRIEYALTAMVGMLVLIVGLAVAAILTMLLAIGLSSVVFGVFHVTVSKSHIVIGIVALLAVTGLLGFLVDEEEKE